MKIKKEMKIGLRNEHIKMLHEEGAKICQEIGCIWIKHYKNAKKSEQVKCRRCGKKRRGI